MMVIWVDIINEEILKISMKRGLGLGSIKYDGTVSMHWDR